MRCPRAGTAAAGKNRNANAQPKRSPATRHSGHSSRSRSTAVGSEHISCALRRGRDCPDGKSSRLVGTRCGLQTFAAGQGGGRASSPYRMAKTSESHSTRPRSGGSEGIRRESQDRSRKARSSPRLLQCVLRSHAGAGRFPGVEAISRGKEEGAPGRSRPTSGAPGTVSPAERNSLIGAGPWQPGKLRRRLPHVPFAARILPDRTPWRVRLSVRTWPSQGRKTGSIPVRAAIWISPPGSATIHRGLQARSDRVWLANE